jgi:hypothetical protein
VSRREVAEALLKDRAYVTREDGARGFDGAHGTVVVDLDPRDGPDLQEIWITVTHAQAAFGWQAILRHPPRLLLVILLELAEGEVTDPAALHATAATDRLAADLAASAGRHRRPGWRNWFR